MIINPLVNIAIKAARSASKIILRAVDRLDSLEIKEKGHNDFVTEIDQYAEQEIIRIIHEAYPDHAILGEESGATGQSDYTWIIDPLDGTTNFIHGNPNFCISIAVKYKDRLEHGVIYDPLRQELFTATFGNGAFLNDHRIRVSSNQQFYGAILAVGFSSKESTHIGSLLKLEAAVLGKVGGLRHVGSAALDCAYVACGRLEGLVGMGYAPWDIAAGILLIQEAGGLVKDFKGEEYVSQKSLVAANPNLAKNLLQIIEEKVLA